MWRWTRTKEKTILKNSLYLLHTHTHTCIPAFTQTLTHTYSHISHFYKLFPPSFSIVYLHTVTQSHTHTHIHTYPHPNTHIFLLSLIHTLLSISPTVSTSLSVPHTYTQSMALTLTLSKEYAHPFSLHESFHGWRNCNFPMYSFSLPRSVSPGGFSLILPNPPLNHLDHEYIQMFLTKIVEYIIRFLLLVF
jgi:hypothetical protein